MVNFVWLLALSSFLGLKGGSLSDSTIQGVQFIPTPVWRQVLQEAKKTQKFIFVDCYTTWCGPCKQMDAEVYSTKKVGVIMSANFISVKMQMDTSRQDDDRIKASYADARLIDTAYHINAYPTMLFFSPEGLLLDRQVGGTSVDDFCRIVSSVIKAGVSYYTGLEKFRKGNRDVDTMRFLAVRALGIGDTTEAGIIARACLPEVLKNLRLTRENIGFLKDFTKSTADPGFKVFYRKPDSVDLVMADDQYAQSLVAGLISKEMVTPVLAQAKADSMREPDWARLEDKVRRAYNSYYAARVVLAARPAWEGQHHNWDVWAKYYVMFEDKYRSKTASGRWAAFHLNNAAWAIFTYTMNREALQSALAWSGQAVLMDPQPNWMDTYANILYKLGRVDEAILWEQAVCKLDPKNKEFQENLAKIQSGQPTWKKYP